LRAPLFILRICESFVGIKMDLILLENVASKLGIDDLHRFFKIFPDSLSMTESQDNTINLKFNGRDIYSFIFGRNGELEESGHIWTHGREGLWISRYENGGLASITTYSGGKRNGKYIELWKNGKISQRGTFKEDKLSGLCEYWTDDGHKSVQYIYSDGEPIYWTFYHQNGMKSAEGPLLNDVMVGMWRRWDSRGNLEGEGLLKNGKKEGEWREYDYDQHAIVTRFYSEGVRI
jgi:antitoxin component YwqK of YwqJK toxin-antitoxin module